MSAIHSTSGSHRPARDELVAVHREELARSLRVAARLRIDVLPDARLYLPALDLGAALRRWMRRVERTLDLLASDSIDLPDAELLGRCLRRPLEDWPDAGRLAEASLLAQDGLAGRVRLAQVALTAGASAHAVDILQRAIGAAHLCRGAWTGSAFEWLAYAHESLGRHRLALGACDAAGREPPARYARWDPLLTGVVLALRVGDEPRARWFRSELARPPDRAGGRSEAPLDLALARLRARIDRWRGPFEVCPPPSLRGVAAAMLRSESRALRGAVEAAWGERSESAERGRARAME